MTELVPSVVVLLFVTTLLVFLVYRLRLFGAGDPSGRVSYVLGGSLVLVASAWELVRAHPDYSRWFLSSVYPVLEVAQYAVLAAGLLMLAVGLALYADYWQSRGEEIESREGKLSILGNIQQDAKQPYQLLELL
ncbi:MAG: hypothetical protein JSU65_04285, partial [Candidatus Zixiibacteriota bacterium]